jgi:hypothetical protein
MRGDERRGEGDAEGIDGWMDKWFRYWQQWRARAHSGDGHASMQKEEEEEEEEKDMRMEMEMEMRSIRVTGCDVSK